MIVWLIGMSGSGKSTLAKKIIKDLREKGEKALLIDGDDFRKAFVNDLGYTLDDRKINAERIVNVCKLCDKQNIHVICAILAIFPEILKRNKEIFSNYYEVFIDAPLDDLKKRNTKGLYNNKTKNVVGHDIQFPKPEAPNLIIKNNGSETFFLNQSNLIVKKLISNE